VVRNGHHQPAPVGVALGGEPGDVGVDLGLQRLGQHPAGPVTDDLIDQRGTGPVAAGVIGASGSRNYGEHRGRTFPTGVGAPALLEGLQDDREGTTPLVDLAHPQVSSIAPVPPTRLAKAQCTGEVGIFGAHIGGQLNCTDTVFTGSNGRALTGDGLIVDARMLLFKAKATGVVRLPDARIGQLNCTDAVFGGSDGRALSAEGMVVNTDIVLRKVQCIGEVQLFGARIGGQLNCTEAVFSNPDGRALTAVRLVVGTDLFMRKTGSSGNGVQVRA
jgi:hypothetical protein